MDKIKQVIVMRKDLNMRKGKIIAQGAHASLKIILDKLCKNNYQGEKKYKFSIDLNEDMVSWMDDYFTKICLSVNSENELLEIYRKAREVNLPASLIKDAGFTEFKEPTYTCCAIGPAKSDEIDFITGNLSLL